MKKKAYITPQLEQVEIPAVQLLSASATKVTVRGDITDIGDGEDDQDGLSGD